MEVSASCPDGDGVDRGCCVSAVVSVLDEAVASTKRIIAPSITEPAL